MCGFSGIGAVVQHFQMKEAVVPETATHSVRQPKGAPCCAEYQSGVIVCGKHKKGCKR